MSGGNDGEIGLVGLVLGFGFRFMAGYPGLLR